MCKHRNSRYVCKEMQGYNFRVDGCLSKLIYILKTHGIQTVGCCCGHGKYPMTILYQSPNGKVWDIISGLEIPRKKRFYVKDKEGYYYIPEVMSH